MSKAQKEREGGGKKEKERESLRKVQKPILRLLGKKMPNNYNRLAGFFTTKVLPKKKTKSVNT